MWLPVRKFVAAGEKSSLTLPRGICLIYARCKDSLGNQIEGQNTCFIGENIPGFIESIFADLRDRCDAEMMRDYEGGLRLLAEQAQESILAKESDLSAVFKLADIVRCLSDGVAPMTKMDGTWEWAYLSEVDGTYQPFCIKIPRDYNANQAYPLMLRMHGGGSTHKARYFGSDFYEDTLFHLWVMGRSRRSGYCGLARRDVIDALNYVKKHWNIDPDRIHLTGNSMGGGGTFKIASCHPDLFASAVPRCGYGLRGCRPLPSPDRL